METILQAVANVGFPIAISAYLLIRIEGKLEVLADSIAGLTSVVAEMRRDVP
ncbi:MAG: YvrJ family protein [Peptococcaceae bacterium]|nr:MAG: YvrJ family protein [Peptococcaceae bacterium]